MNPCGFLNFVSRPSRRPAGLAPVSAALLGMVLLGGCMTPSVSDPARLGPFFTPVNFVGERSLPRDLRRVVLLPISGGDVAPAETVTALAATFAAALQRQDRFEVVTLAREECRRRFGVDELSSTAVLPRTMFADLQKEFGADGVLFVDLTVFRGYRPLALGLRSKLARCGDSRLVWTFDTVFSTDDPAVANSARHHFIASDGRGVPGDLSPAVLQSPSRFADYAATAMFTTLPPVWAPVVPPVDSRKKAL